jgi:hypothetical protein
MVTIYCYCFRQQGSSRAVPRKMERANMAKPIKDTLAGENSARGQETVDDELLHRMTPCTKK